MAYSADSFVADEQPTTAKWNKLWSNDAAFNDSSGINFQIDNLAGMSNPYKFHGWRNAAQNMGNGTPAVVQCDVETFDTNGNFDITTNKGRYTAPVDGFYMLAGQAEATIGINNGRTISCILKNGSLVKQGSSPRGASSAFSMASAVSALISLSSGDYVELGAFGDAAGALTVGAETDNYFCGFLVSKT